MESIAIQGAKRIERVGCDALSLRSIIDKPPLNVLQCILKRRNALEAVPVQYKRE